MCSWNKSLQQQSLAVALSNGVCWTRPIAPRDVPRTVVVAPVGRLLGPYDVISLRNDCTVQKTRTRARPPVARVARKRVVSLCTGENTGIASDAHVRPVGGNGRTDSRFTRENIGTAEKWIHPPFKAQPDQYTSRIAMTRKSFVSRVCFSRSEACPCRLVTSRHQWASGRSDLPAQRTRTVRWISVKSIQWRFWTVDFYLLVWHEYNF